MNVKTAIPALAFLVSVGCTDKPRQQETEATPITCPPQKIDGDVVRLTGFRRTGEWERHRTASGGRLFPQDAEEGFEFFVVQVEIDTQGVFKELRFGSADVSALADDGKRYGLSMPPAMSMVLVADQESGTTLNVELPIKVPSGTDVRTIEIRGVSFDIQ